MKFLFSTEPEPVPEPIPIPEQPFLKEWHEPVCQLIIILVHTVIMVFMMSYLEDLMMNLFDDNRRKAKKKAKKLMEELGLKHLKLTNQEYMIASNLVTQSELSVNWSNIAGLNDIIGNLKHAVIYPLQARKSTHKKSKLIVCPKGILLHGPPGCGKTLIAKAMAKEIKCCFINLDITSLQDKYLGESEKLVKAVFTLAEKIQPCIIFIDEIDAILRTRSICDCQVSANAKTQFMTLWDGLLTDPEKVIIIVGATNRPADVDKAILRRMTIKMHIPLPDLAQRKSILEIILKNENLNSNVDFEKLAEKTDGFSGSDLKNMSQSAAINCLKKNRTENIANKTVPQEDTNRVKSVGVQSDAYLTPKHENCFNHFVNSIIGSISKDKIEMAGSEDGENNNVISFSPISMEDFEVAIQNANKAKELLNNIW